MAPNESRDVLHTAPLLFDYARATGYHTAYWTSQNMMFGNVRLWVQNLGVGQFVHATMVNPASDIDLGAPEGKFADYLIPKVETLEEPFFLTIQLSNGHYPYLVDETGPKPFQPSTTSKAPEDNAAFRNFYQNAVYQQDAHLARLLGALKKASYGSRTIFVVTSDHGEAFREHYQMGHTFSMFDEEVKVPAYVVAPPGTLTPEEEEELRKKKNVFRFHPDFDGDDPRSDGGVGRSRALGIPSATRRRESPARERAYAHSPDDELCGGLVVCFRELGLHRRNEEARGARVGRELSLLRFAQDPGEKKD
ncbi:MAG: sulfatase-like hydrolase/transferase [Muricomes sp.]